MAHLIVERTFPTALADGDFEAAAERLLPCIHDRGGRWIRSYLSRDGTRTICEFEAPDAESVRMAHRTAGIPFERVWPAERFTPEPEPVASS